VESNTVERSNNKYTQEYKRQAVEEYLVDTRLPMCFVKGQTVKTTCPNAKNEYIRYLEMELDITDL